MHGPCCCQQYQSKHLLLVLQLSAAAVSNVQGILLILLSLPVLVLLRTTKRLCSC
jgi:hypothetical protein